MPSCSHNLQNATFQLLLSRCGFDYLIFCFVVGLVLALAKECSESGSVQLLGLDLKKHCMLSLAPLVRYNYLLKDKGYVVQSLCCPSQQSVNCQTFELGHLSLA